MKFLPLLLLTTLFFGAGKISAQTYDMANGTVNACSGIFYDSHDTSNYGNNENLTETFCSAMTGQCIVIDFTSFNTENTNDILEIYDGPSTASPSIGSYTGTISPGQ